jgi:fucose permease
VEGSRQPGTVLLYGGFLFTGAMAVLLGAVLPRAAALYRLHDVQAGTLLTIEFATSACGALLVRRRFERTVKTGYALMAVGAMLLAVSRGMMATASIGVFGLGLGMAMTSTSLVIGRVFSTSRGSALSTLNFCWSIGATACPLVVARWSGSFSPRALCLPIAAISGILMILLQVSRLPSSFKEWPAPSVVPGVDVKPIILRFAAIAFLYVGVEATAGGWISTYA